MPLLSAILMGLPLSCLTLRVGTLVLSPSDGATVTNLLIKYSPMALVDSTHSSQWSLRAFHISSPNLFLVCWCCLRSGLSIPGCFFLNRWFCWSHMNKWAVDAVYLSTLLFHPKFIYNFYCRPKSLLWVCFYTWAKCWVCAKKQNTCHHHFPNLMCINFWSHCKALQRKWNNSRK